LHEYPQKYTRGAERSEYGLSVYDSLSTSRSRDLGGPQMSDEIFCSEKRFYDKLPASQLCKFKKGFSFGALPSDPLTRGAVPGHRRRLWPDPHYRFTLIMWHPNPGSANVIKYQGILYQNH